MIDDANEMKSSISKCILLITHHDFDIFRKISRTVRNETVSLYFCKGSVTYKSWKVKSGIKITMTAVKEFILTIFLFV